MSLETRLLTDDDLPAAIAISSYAFNAPRTTGSDGALARARRVSEPDWYLGSFENGEMTAMMQIIPVETYLNGATIPMGAVSPVASSPLHRRKGHASQMLRESLALMKQRGQVISGLTTPHPALYRRYGWEISADRRNYSFNPKDFRPTQEPRELGRFRTLGTEDWAQLDAVYARYAVAHNGPLRRDERWWRESVLNLPWNRISDIVLWEDETGGAQGYALYRQPEGESSSLSIIELIALTGDAYLNLLMYFARHDLYGEVLLRASVQDALPLLFADTERLQVKEHYTVMLRVVDFEAALRARLPARADESAEVVLRLEDRDAPWNEGTWRIGVSEGRTLVERTDTPAELTVSERMIAPLFNGHLRPTVAFESGLIAATREEALERADRVFAVTRPPYFPDTF